MSTFKFTTPHDQIDYTGIVIDDEVLALWKMNSGKFNKTAYTLEEFKINFRENGWKITSGVFDYKKLLPELADEFYFKHPDTSLETVYKCRKFDENCHEVTTGKNNIGTWGKYEIQRILSRGFWVICDNPEEKLDVSILKPYMRVVIRGHGVWMVANDLQDGSLIAIAKGRWVSLPRDEYDEGVWRVMAVYNPPLYNSQILTLKKLGRQLWAHSEFNESMIKDYENV